MKHRNHAKSREKGPRGSRRKARRALVGTGLVLSAINAQLAIATPAFAFLSPGDGYHETSGGADYGYSTGGGGFWGDYWDTQGGGEVSGGGEDPQAQDPQAFAVVTTYLSNPSCRALIKGTSSFDPEQVWRSIQIYDMAPATKPGSPTAWASAPLGAGTNGYIQLWAPYHTVVFELSNYPALDPAKLARTPTPAETRAMILLHELAHLTGALGPHFVTPKPNEYTPPSPGEIGLPFNHQILERCTGLLKK